MGARGGGRSSRKQRMRILSSLTYYEPHISGLTIYAKRALKGLAARGHQTTIVTSQFARHLPKRETVDGVTVVRTRATVKVSKGIVMPFYPFRMARELARHDVLLLHLPQFESPVAAVLARLMHRRIVTVCHCDIDLPPGIVRTVFMPLIRAAHFVTGVLSDVIVVNSRDYAENSRYLRRFRKKVIVSPPPCELRDAAGTFIARPEASPVIGFVGRFAEEKGITYLVDALPRILERAPRAHVVFVGEWQHVVGERVYDKLKDRLDALAGHITLTGTVSDEELAAWFHAFDVLVLPSVNSTESFGMVQVEAMLAGTPVVASDRPGVREPVLATGMGELVPPRDAGAIAEAVLRVAADRERYARPREAIERIFGVERCVSFFEALLGAVRDGAELPSPGVLRLTGEGS